MLDNRFISSERLIDAILYWSQDETDFDDGYVKYLDKELSEGRGITDAQYTSLLSIVKKFKIMNLEVQDE